MSKEHEIRQRVKQVGQKKQQGDKEQILEEQKTLPRTGEDLAAMAHAHPPQFDAFIASNSPLPS